MQMHYAMSNALLHQSIISKQFKKSRDFPGNKKKSRDKKTAQNRPGSRDGNPNPAPSYTDNSFRHSQELRDRGLLKSEAI